MEFGDYQTPAELAAECCGALARLGIRPVSLLEPTCGTGSFLEAALAQFPEVTNAVGVEVDSAYAREAVRRTGTARRGAAVRIEEGNFFTLDWDAVMSGLPDPLLVIGNPPWVTNSALGQIGSANLPRKENLSHQNGLDAITGKSNFDISEWMLMRLFERLHGRNAAIAMLAKTAVARKVLQYAWKKGFHVGAARLFAIDAGKHFGAAVDACFLVCEFSPGAGGRDCVVNSGFGNHVEGAFGYRDGALAADVERYEKWRHLRGTSSYKWRSGVKHDCSRVMEFHRHGRQWKNGLHEGVDIEDTYLYPMFKGSDVANGCVSVAPRWMLVPQRRTGEDTSAIRLTAPKTWEYLEGHRAYLDARGSRIYRNRPPFSIFGIGDYSFAPWKVAIAGLYKRLAFRVIGPCGGRPAMLDDTVYFLPCASQGEAEALAALLHSPAAEGFLRAFIFWDAKRPITASLLSRLSIERLAAEPCATQV